MLFKIIDVANYLLKTFIAVLNVMFLGLGYAISGNPKKAIVLQIIAGIVFFIGGISNIFAYFYGFIAIYSLIAVVYFYAFISSFYLKEIHFQHWIKCFFIYALLVIIIKLSLIMPVRKFYFEPLKAEENMGEFIRSGDYIMSDISNKKIFKPLYIFWSKDISRIGDEFDK